MIQFQFKHIKPDFFELNEDNKSDKDTDDDGSDNNDDTVNDCLDQLIYNLDKGVNHSDSDDSPNDELNNALSPLQAAQLALQQHQKPTQHSFTPPCKKRMFDSNEYKQLHKQMLLENLYGSENFMKNELAAMQCDNDVADAGGSGALAASWGIGEDDEDAAIVELEQSFALNYWHTANETERQKDKNKEKEKTTNEQEKIIGRELETHDHVGLSQRSNSVSWVLRILILPFVIEIIIDRDSFYLYILHIFLHKFKFSSNTGHRLIREIMCVSDNCNG